MRQFLLSLILFLLLTFPAEADAPIYLPILQSCGVNAVSDWKVIVPTSGAVTNKVLNPSGEIAGNFAALGSATVTRITASAGTPSHYGLYSYNVVTVGNDDGVSFTLEALANLDQFATVRVFGTIPTWDWSLDDITYTAPTLLENIDSLWRLYGLSIPAAQANGSTTLYIRQNQTGAFSFYLDGIQVEDELSDGEGWSTYCDGSQTGCEWNGVPNGSSSQRSESSRAGGVVYDLEDDYGFEISGMSGSGTSPQELFVDSYSQLPGGELNSIKTNSRVITLAGLIRGSTQVEFHQKKRLLKSIFAKDAVPQDQNGYQPIRIRYVGAEAHKEIALHYEGGLEANITADDPCGWEKVAIRFIAPNPYWYEIGESAALLDTNDSATFRYVAARLRSTGQWSVLGPPNASGTYTDIYAVAEDATYIYWGGDFLNFDNIAAADYIVRYNKATGVYSAMAALNGIVRAIAIAPNGDVIVGGDFTNASGVAAADNIAVWAVGASAFTALGVPISGAAVITNVRALAYDGSGNLYIGGDFDNWANVAAADNLVMWNGSAYVAVSTGANNTVHALAIGVDKITLFVGGEFTTPGNFLAQWDGSAFTDIGTGIDLFVRALAVDSTGLLYVGGAMTTPVARIGIWNGSILSPMGNGLDVGSVTAITIGSDGSVWVGSGVISSTYAGLSRWNGSVFAFPDVSLPGTPPTSPVIRALLASRYVDPIVSQKYNVWIGFNATGTGTFAGKVTASNSGTVPAFPKIYYNRSGGTTATIQTLRNERNGQEMFFNYSLLNGETLAIDLSATKKSINSNFFGPRQDAVLPNSDFGDWQLLVGNNDITSLVTTSGSPTITAWMVYKAQFDAQD